MIENGQLTSLLIKNQLPEYIRDNPDYEKFHTFIRAYYEWMEQTGKVAERSKNLLSYKDIDNLFLQIFQGLAKLQSLSKLSGSPLSQ